MQYRKLGQTGIEVSVICLGTMTFGEQNNEADAHAQLDYALERGVNFIDTAEMYPVPPGRDTYTRTEQYIGSWLQKRGRRDNIVLASKIAGPSRGNDGQDYIRGGSRFTRAPLAMPRSPACTPITSTSTSCTGRSGASITLAVLA